MSYSMEAEDAIRDARMSATNDNAAIVFAAVAQAQATLQLAEETRRMWEQLRIGNRIAVAHLAHDADTGNSFHKLIDRGDNPDRIFEVGDDELRTARLKSDIAKGLDE